MKCPICTNKSKKVFDTKYVAVAKCSNNNCEHYYSITSNIGDGICELSEEKDYNLYAKRNYRLIDKWFKSGFISADSHLMDIGTGYGHIVQSISEYNSSIQINCVEPSLSYFERLVNIGLNVFKDIEDLPDQKHDSALLIEVIEHVDKPIEILKGIKSKLKQGGKLFITTPAGNIRAGHPDPASMGAYSNATHVHFFTEKSLKLALKKAGFSRVNFAVVAEFYPNKYDIKGFEKLKYVFRRRYLHFRGQTQHLTYYAS